MPDVAHQPARASLPLFYVLLPLAALALSLATYGSPNVNMLRFAVLGSAAVGAILLIDDALLMWRYGRGVGRLTLNLSVFYWFWLGGITMALTTPAFPTPDPIYPGFRDVVPGRVVSIGLVCVNLFTLTTQLGWRYVPLPRRLLRTLADRVDPRSSAWLDLLAFGMAALSWVPIGLAYEWDLQTAVHDLLLMRTEGQVGPTQDVGLAHHLHLIGLFGGAFAVARIVFHVRGILWLRYLAVVISVPIAYFGSASRFNFGFMVLPAILMLGAPLSHQLEWRKRRRVLTVLLVSTVLLVLYQGAIRFTGVGGDVVRQGSLAQTLRSGYFGHDQFGPMLIAINLVDEQGFYFMEPMTPFFFTQFIPRASWPDKPDPQSWVTYNEAWTQGHDFNVTPSVTGQYYMNWSYFGVAWIGLFIGWLARFCEAWFARLHVAQQLLSATVAGLLLAFVFFSFRIYHPMYFAYPLFGYLTYRLVTKRRPAGAATN